MSKGILLTQDFLHASDVMPVQGDPTDFISPSVYDIPREVGVSEPEGGYVVFRFVYPDREEAGDAETPLDEGSDILLRRGRYSGKIMTLRAPAGRVRTPAVVERLKRAAPRQARKNQELNFLLLSNILREKQAELQPA
ncbi:MAG: hypothetical protein C0501_05170 [Isosphaera sp.]|nr:hypothetical protein [Isosphaera sp.]